MVTAMAELMHIDTLREIFVIELRITLGDGRQSLQLCGTAHQKEEAEYRVNRLPKPEGYEYKIVRYIPEVAK